MNYDRRRITEALSKDEGYSTNSRVRIENYQLHDSEIFNQEDPDSFPESGTLGKDFDPKEFNFAPQPHTNFDMFNTTDDNKNILSQTHPASTSAAEAARD